MVKMPIFFLVAALILAPSGGTPLAASPDGAEIPVKVKEKGKEREVSIDEVPEPAREVILAKAHGRKIIEVEKVTFSDRVVYEAEWKDRGKQVEIEVASGGEVIRMTFGGEDIADDPEDADDDEDGDEEDED